MGAMQVILHIGVHCTDEDRLLKGLLRNGDQLRHRGVAVPGPSRYRNLLSELLNELNESAPTPEARDVVLDAILDEDPEQVERVVLSHENLFSVPKIALGGGKLYRKAERRLTTLAQVFAGDDLRLCMGLRNPVTFLPACWQATPHDSFDAFMNGVDPQQVRWSELVARIRTAVPEVPVTLWCNEDTPMIWGEIMREMLGLDLAAKLNGDFDMMAEIVSPEGMARFRGFLRENPHINEVQKRRVMAAFIEKYVVQEAVEEELDMPGWDEAFVEAMTAAYEADVAQLAEMPGVRVLEP